MSIDLDTAMCDELLSTTRAVRKRLDLEREVPRDLINECLELAVQAPTGSNTQGWRWVIVDDATKRERLGELYRRAAAPYLQGAVKTAAPGQTLRVFESALYLMDHLEQVPVHVIPCIVGTPSNGLAAAGFYASIYPAVWNFQLALRARGLGSCLTTLHLAFAREAAELLKLPDNLTQTALLPVAYTKGTNFKRAQRPPVANITHWNEWLD